MRIRSALKKIPYLSRLKTLARRNNIRLYLVGGFLRDALLNVKKEYVDFDFCVEENARRCAKKAAQLLGAKLITLDEKQQSYRCIVKKKYTIYTYDFTQLRGKDLQEDMSLRDFTINTLAYELTPAKTCALIDSLGARRDLALKRIKVPQETVLVDDPLRILRAFSFQALYGFHIEKKTYAYLKKHRKLLRNVSGERINEELFKIFNSPVSYKVIRRMSAERIIDEVIPHISVQRRVSQGAYHHRDVWGHSLETLERFETLYARKLSKNAGIRAYLERPLAAKHRLIHIIKLACLLHDAGKPAAKKIKNKKTIFHAHEKIGADLMDDVYERLKLSLSEKEILKRLIFWHLRPGYLADQKYPSRRAVYRFFRDTQDEGAAVIFLSLADWRATRGPLTNARKRKKHERIMLNLIDRYFEEKKERPLPRLVDGYDIMRMFGIGPSALVGHILKSIAEEQALGRIETKAEAYSLARTLLEKKKLKKK